MGAITAHEFMTLDGVVETPAWTFEFGFDPQMGETIATLVRPSLVPSFSAAARASDAPQRTISRSSRERGESPRARRCMASRRFVFPAPFGPTKAVRPGSSAMSARS